MKAYWAENSQLKWGTAESLFQSTKFADSLFFYHLAIESLLKALCVKTTKGPAPYTHDLVRLAELCQLTLNESQRKILQDITKYNLEARYPDEKFEFYKGVNARFASDARKNIHTIHLWIKKQLP